MLNSTCRFLFSYGKTKTYRWHATCRFWFSQNQINAKWKYFYLLVGSLIKSWEWIFSWHPKSEKWVLPRTSSYISIGRVPEGHESFGNVWTSPWQNHFSDFGCQEKAFSEITVLNSKMLKMQILCCQKTREINAIQMDTTRR